MVTQSKLGGRERALYARQISLAEIGEAGQQKLCELAVRVPAASDSQNAGTELLTLYLERAGLTLLSVEESAGERALLARAAESPSPELVTKLAGRKELEPAAQALAASFEAVEVLKAALQVGTPGTLPAELVLGDAP